MPDPISWSAALPYYALSFAIGYSLGAIPFALILVKVAGLGDVRKVGSGNVGATNVLRTGRKDLALLTLMLDGGKGFAGTFLAFHLWGPDAALMAGAGAFLGHLYPVWLKFKGGKGVATALGVLFALNWQVALAVIPIWLIATFGTRMSSVGSLGAALAAPFLAWFLDGRQLAEFSALLAAFIWFAHRSNIGRILRGTENRIGAKSTTFPPSDPEAGVS